LFTALLMIAFISTSVILEYPAWPEQVGHGLPAWIFSIGSIAECQSNDCVGLSVDLPAMGFALHRVDCDAHRANRPAASSKFS
jgi:hypothetical protein